MLSCNDNADPKLATFTGFRCQFMDKATQEPVACDKLDTLKKDLTINFSLQAKSEIDEKIYKYDISLNLDLHRISDSDEDGRETC